MGIFKGGRLSIKPGYRPIRGTHEQDFLWAPFDDVNDKISGGRGDDTLIGNGGDDILIAADGNDRLYGGDGDDKLYGMKDNDMLSGGIGNDTLKGGKGTDTVYERGDVDFRLTHSRLYGRGTDKLDSIEQAELIGGSSNNTLDVSAFRKGKVTLKGQSGNDVLLGGRKDDFLYGGSDDDFLDGNRGNDFLDGGRGYDTVRITGSDFIEINGNEVLTFKKKYSHEVIERDRITNIEKIQFQGDRGDNSIIRRQGINSPRFEGELEAYGGKGKDYLNAYYSSVAMLDGGRHDDRLVGNYQHGRSWLYGRDGDDLLQGGSGDRLFGGNDDDELTGTNGVQMYGGNGSDQFTIERSGTGGIATIHDFKVGEDILARGRGFYSDSHWSLPTSQSYLDYRSTVQDYTLGASTPDVYWLYEQNSGELFFNQSYAGGTGAPLHVATFANQPDLAGTRVIA